MPLSTLFAPLIAAALLALPLSAAAEEEAPNLKPGQWEFTSVTSVEGDLPIPEQTDTHQECLTQEDIDEANIGMLEEEESCDLLEKNGRSDGMSFRMACSGQGGEATIVGDMRYFGDRIEGDMTVETAMPMGKMTMNTTIEGKRLGDC